MSQERAVGNASVDQRSGGVEDGSVGEHGPVSHDMSGSVGSGSGSVCRHARVGHLHDTDICLTSLITKICANLSMKNTLVDTCMLHLKLFQMPMQI